ncbi:MAG TPA: deoxynucleoside kinase [Pseudomonadales bacterium]|jgi:deoxyadenosine/deoxycytidine kinase
MSASALHDSYPLPDAGQLPRFITIEGPIGVGKTSLARKLASTFNYQTLLEQADENPFLKDFYRNRSQHALSTQLFFLFQRAKQIQELRQNDLFEPIRVSDFLIEKDRLFAELTLNEHELGLYQQVYDSLTIDAPQPDLVIYLQAPADTLMRRIQQRGIAAEQSIDRRYLESLNEAYSQFFLYYDASPLLVVNAEQIDPVHNDRDFQQLVEYLPTVRRGRHYYNPSFFS